MEAQMTATCSAPDCDRAVNARGWCNTHYSRWKRHGDPQFDKPVENPAKGITPQMVYEALAAYIGEHGYAPSVRELGELVGLDSPASTHAHLATLEDQGLIKRRGPRAIRLLEQP